MLYTRKYICQEKGSSMQDRLTHIGNIATLLGVLSQLYSYRMNTLLKEHGLTLSQFSVLNHLAHSPRAASINQLTEVMEMNQPGISKIVRRLQEENFLKVGKSAEDSRQRMVSINQSGRAHIEAINRLLAPELASWFADWDEGKLERFEEDLSQLRTWLDKHRL